MIFEVTPEHIESLTDTDLRTLVGHLCEREIYQLGGSPACVTFGGDQRAPDGGIDVHVEGCRNAEGFVPRSVTGFQVKASPFATADITKEMKPGGKLRASIAALIASGGAYIIVSSKTSASKSSLDARRQAMKNAVADQPDSPALHLDFYDQRRIASWVNLHPAMVAWVRLRVGAALAGWRPFDDWSASPGECDETYLLDDALRIASSRGEEGQQLSALDGLNAIRLTLSEPAGVVRLVGLSGVGKTRLAQALFDSKVGAGALGPNLALYTDLADSPDPLPLELAIRLNSLHQACVMIVDNCGAELHRRIATQIKRSNGNVRLLTIEYDISDDEQEGTEVFRLEPSSSRMIELILERRHPHLMPPEIRTIAAFSEGNARIALALADTSKRGDSLASLKDDELFKRLFRQKNGDDPALLRAAKVSSLVYSFDCEKTAGKDAELPLLAALAGQRIADFHGHIAELRRRQLVQARGTFRALLPHALAHRLARQALQDIPRAVLQREFLDAAPGRLFRSFTKRIGSLHDSVEAGLLVSEWLAPDGLLAKIETFSYLEFSALEDVAPVNPRAALEVIESAAARRGDFFVPGGPIGLRLIRTLRGIAYEAGLFDRATRLIAGFARYKTESNNLGDAVNVFQTLFYLFLSGTCASAQQRANLLRNLSASSDPRDRTLVIIGLGAMLKSDSFSSSLGFDFGARKRDYGFHPKQWPERRDWWRTAIALAGELAERSDFRVDVRRLMVERFKWLGAGPEISDDLIALAHRFAEDGGWPEGWVGVRRAHRAAVEAGNTEIAEKLLELELKLKPNSLSQRLASYVLPPQWGALDIAEVDLADADKHAKAREHVSLVCTEIGQQLGRDLEALEDFLPRLLTADSERVGHVGEAAGEYANDPLRAWDIILDAMMTPNKQATYRFSVGFLSGLARKKRSMVETFFDHMAVLESCDAFASYLQVCVGVNERGYRRLLRAISKPSVPLWQFRGLAYQYSRDALPEPLFKDLVLAIAARGPDGLNLAIDILGSRLRTMDYEKEPVHRSLSEAGLSLLNQFKIPKEGEPRSRSLSLFARFGLDLPDGLGVATQICGQLRYAIERLWIPAWDYGELIAEISVHFPALVLDLFVEQINTGYDDRRYIFGNFRGHQPCPLRKIPDEILLAWAREKPGTRFVQLAETLVPFRSNARGERGGMQEEQQQIDLAWTPLAFALLREAPDPVAVASEFQAHFQPSGWSGSLARILESRVPLLQTLVEHLDPRISNWATSEIIEYKQLIERWRLSEAAENRSRGERFEY